MKILAIETSCDETAVSIVDGRGGAAKPHLTVLAHFVWSQVAAHEKWGGVVPTIAKREHSRHLVPLLRQALGEADLIKPNARPEKNHLSIGGAAELRELLTREPELLETLLQFIPTVPRPAINAVAVTRGPGLEPALWVGINFARALAQVWQLPIVPINHLEGHLASVLIKSKTPRAKLPTPNSLKFPLVALLVSGGHTELILARDWMDYELLGATRDDAAGEAFDKVARLLELGYPGGPAIARMAEHGSLKPDYCLPRPMLRSGNFDFSFSGLKTAVLYLVKKIGQPTNIERADIARQFQQAVIEVLIIKTLAAVKQYQPKTLVLGGGVAANAELKRQFGAALAKTHPEVTLLVPDLALATDNATMIAAAAYLRLASGQMDASDLTADGNLPLA